MIRRINNKFRSWVQVLYLARYPLCCAQRTRASHRIHTLCSAQRIMASSSVCLPDEIIEASLGFLSITDTPNAALVCKQWLFFITCSPVLRAISYSIHKPKPWLFLFAPNKSQSSGFDPLAGRWVRLPPLNLHFKEENRVTEGNRFLFSLTGGRLKFTQSFLNPRQWKETSAPMRVWRQHPVACLDYGRNKMFVMGGVCEFEEDPLSVEMFDLSSGAWETCDPLPDQFKESASSTWLSSDVFHGKIFVIEKFRGDCCCFELESKRWGRVVKLRPPPSSPSEWTRYYCLTCRSGFVLAELRREEAALSFRMWIVDENKMQCKADTEIRMPCQMLDLLAGRERTEEQEDHSSSFREEIDCKGGGDIIYVLRNSGYENKDRVCVYDLCTGVWDVLADDPDLGMNNRDKAMVVCSPVTLDETSFTLNVD